MIKINQIILIILAVLLLSSCNFISTAFKAKSATKDFIEALLREDYDKCIDYMAMDHEIAKNTDIDVMKLGLSDFREHIVENFGTDLDYSFMKAEKVISTIEEKNTPPNTTVVLIQYSNDKEFGVIKVLFDEASGKILHIKTLDVKRPIPSMTMFWLFGLLALCVPIFNIYVIREIKRSQVKRKWLKYIAVILLNAPTFTYAAINGFSLNLFYFQMLLGISFNYMGYLNTAWAVGVPLGGLYWFWRLKIKKIKEINIAEDSLMNNVKLIEDEESCTSSTPE